MSEERNCQACHGSCNDCNEGIENGCPICGKKGMEVPFETVESLAVPFLKNQLSNYKNDEPFYLCISRPCTVAYYSKNQVKLLVNQIKVPIWYKQITDPNEYIVCYCRKISLYDIQEAVKNLTGEINQSAVITYLNKENNEINIAL